MKKLTYLLVLVSSFSHLAALAQQDFVLPDEEVIEQIYQEIDQAELEGGAYAYELGELWLALGQTLKQRQDFDEAFDLVTRGMHINRVNQGLTSATQVVYLNELSEIEHLRGNPKASTEYSHQALKLYGQSLKNEQPQLMDHAMQFADKHLAMYDSSRKKGNADHLISAHSFAHSATWVAAKHLNDEPEKQRQAYLKLAYLSYQLASNLSTSNIYDYRKVTQYEIATSSRFSSETSAQSFDVWLDKGYKVGRDALTANLKSRSQQADVSGLSLAQDTARLADWYLLFGFRHKATKTYLSAWKTLNATEKTEIQASEFFGKPQLITFKPEEKDIPKDSATFELDISISGFVRKAELVSTTAEVSVKKRKQLLRSVKSLRFRPQLLNGRPTITKNFTFTLPVKL